MTKNKTSWLLQKTVGGYESVTSVKDVNLMSLSFADIKCKKQFLERAMARIRFFFLQPGYYYQFPNYLLLLWYKALM